MNAFIITFSRVGIINGWVHVTAKDEDIARAWAAYEYGQVWSGIYTPEDFYTAETAQFFPRGELGRTTLAYDEASHVPVRKVS